MKFNITKKQEAVLDSMVERMRQQILAGNVCFELDKYQVAEYFGDDMAELSIKEFRIVCPVGNDDYLCIGWFRGSIFDRSIKAKARISAFDIIVPYPGFLVKFYCVLNLLKQCVGIKPDFINYELV